MGKALTASKTAWFNLVMAIALAALAAFTQSDVAKDYPDALWWAQRAVEGLTVVGNYVLRFLTKEPITKLL